MEDEAMKTYSMKLSAQLMACGLVVVLSGCAAITSGHIPVASTNKTASLFFESSEATVLGEATSAITRGHGEESGFLLLDRGRDALSWRLILADAAETSIDIQTFVWNDDAIGKVYMQHLLNAAERGVRVRILIDDSITTSDPAYLALLGAAPNVEVRLYKPFGPKSKSVLKWVDFAIHMKVLNRRMHNKIYVVDGCMEIIGGRNIGNEYFDYPGAFVFRCRDLLALGPVVKASGAAFDLYWNSDWAVPIEEVVTHIPTAAEERVNKASLDAFAAISTNYPSGFYDDPKQLDTELAQLKDKLHWGKGRLLIDAVPNRNGKPQTHAELDRTGVAIGRVASQTTTEALVQSAYMILEDSGIAALRAMVDRGVKVKLHTNSLASNNHLSAYVAYRKQRKDLINGGGEVFEFRPDARIQQAKFTEQERIDHNMKFGLHAKTMVFDRKIVFVGSFNLDPRSANLNTETGLLVESEALAQAVAASLENDIAPGNSWRVLINDKKHTVWVTLENGITNETFTSDPMTTEAERAKAEAIEFIPDSGQM
jgi:putative cardiolipin synthase